MPKKKTTRKKTARKAPTKKTSGAKSDGFSVPDAPKRSKVARSKSAAFVHKPTRRKKGPGERVAIYFPVETAEDLRVFCALERRTLTDVCTEAIKRYLSEQGYKPVRR